MKTMISRKGEHSQVSKSALLLHKYRIDVHHGEALATRCEAREMGKAIAEKIAKKVKLKLDV
ncbi:MAG: hypothetical protein ABSF21_03675 [Dehalococcoidia bacterium]|jgi:hypothetical protein